MKYQKRFSLGLQVILASLLMLFCTGVQAKQVKTKVSKLEKAFKSAQELAKHSYGFKSMALKVPGPRVKKTKTDWTKVSKGFPLSAVKEMQAASLERMKFYRDKAKQTSWKKLKKKRFVGKKVKLGGNVWWLFSEHRYSSNRVLAYQPKQQLLLRATGMYARGQMPALLRVLRYKSYGSLFRKVQKATVLALKSLQGLRCR